VLDRSDIALISKLQLGNGVNRPKLCLGLLIGDPRIQAGFFGRCALIAIAKSFFLFLTGAKIANPPYPPFFKGGNLMELLVKSPFEKGGFRGI
jgi:hypothetical protein